jgi:uncharacterized damage-inducible protein DinB
VEIADARLLVDYNEWANHQLLAAACQLTPAALVQERGASFGSIKGTLLHILDSEWIWLEIWKGKPRPRPLSPDAYADAAALAAAFPSLAAAQRAFLDACADATLASRCRVDDKNYRLSHLIYHAMTHSMYHRGQVVTLLRQAGHKPPNTGMRTGFLDERGLYAKS